ncbi:MAG TPA: hypothetical protein VJH91_03165 [Candidatus Paceibacterota bacterium]
MKPLVIYASAFATVAAILGFKEEPMLITLVSAGLCGLILITDWSTGRLLIAMFSFAVATTAEILIVNAGIWTYGANDVLGIPFWIPFVWVNGAFFFIQLKEDIDRIIRRRRV